jgi:hypothetical protein
MQFCNIKSQEYMKKLFTLFLLISTSLAFGQSKISGKVADAKSEAIAFANISLVGTYDGGTSDENGSFEFITDEVGLQVISVTMMGYEPFKKEITLEAKVPLVLDIKLKESINSLNAVVVSAGMFEASDEKKMVMLKPMDVVTTAGAGADIVAVMQFLPGANRVGEQEGLFVRGGSANETKTVIDGMIVQNPFFSSTPDIPQRGRFNPFMFKGTAFSTGGYSAQYGQALSSVLLLNTVDKVSSNSNLNLSANLAGLGASYTHKGWITGAINYSNIKPFIGLVKNNFNFDKVPQGIGSSVTINQNISKNGVLKAYATYSDNSSAIKLPTFDAENSSYVFSNQNKNFFSNASYKHVFGEGDMVWLSGISVSDNRDLLKLNGIDANRSDKRTQLRSVVNKLFGGQKQNTLTLGAEYHNIALSNMYGANTLSLTDHYTSLFAESEFYVSSKIAGRFGLRSEHTSVLNKFNLAPRFSVAVKSGEFAQFSLAAGRFYQNPEKEYLYINKNLGFEMADHLILNYQVIKDQRTFRIETFYKKYSDLVIEQTPSFDPNPYRFPTGLTNNSGKGYAQGFDVFFRDQKSLKNGDIWLTYSFLDSERKFKNYPIMTTPYFVTKHNLSLVYKQFITPISTNIGFTFTHTSGRPIYAMGETFQTASYTKAFQNFSFMGSHVRQIKNQFVVFYLIMDNILGRKNVFGYRYSPDGSQRFEVKPPMYRTVFFGVSWTLGKLNGRSKEADLNF